MAKHKLALSENAVKVLEKRYLKKGIDSRPVEKPEDLFSRVAHNISLADKNYNANADLQKTEDKFYNLMASCDFMPNSPTLMNAGNDLQQLSACFVLPVDDAIESIFDSIKNAALIHKSGGGTGFAFSRIRPKNDMVLSTKGISSGPVSFMQVFNTATETIKQGGTRRGANMAILRVDHPDIMEFISCKKDLSNLTNFNISVAVTDAFMKAVVEDTDYELFNPRSREITDRRKARDVFNCIVDLAWLNGEPGIIFIDEINRYNPTPEIGEIESTNPCGEQPLLPYEACNLGSINLANFITAEKKIDYERLKTVVHGAVHFLDNVIDMSKFPLDKIKELVQANRKIGLGVMGFADLLYKLEIPYNSERALKTGEDIMSFIDKEAVNASLRLAEERGAFPNLAKSIFAKKKQNRRNATVTTIAPTGTISIISSCSSGIEPLFGLAFFRNVMDGTRLTEVNPVFEETARREGFYSEELMKIIAEHGSIKDIREIPEKWREVFVTAHDITPEWHVKVQAAFQKFVDNAVSKTVNFSEKASRDDVYKAYMLAYELKLKGITIYRDGSRKNQGLNIKSSDAKNSENSKISAIKPRPRPAITEGSTLKIHTACGTLYATINEDEHGLCEVFAQIGKSGGCATAQTEAVSRMISLALRSGLSIESILKQLTGIRCTSPIYDSGEMILSCPHAIAKAIERYIKSRNSSHQAGNKKPIEIGSISIKNMAGNCPECGNVLNNVEGCLKCEKCGYAKC